MYDFEVKKFTRVCALTGREFQAGDTFYAYLIEEDGETVRQDVCQEAWEGPPEDCIAWWKSSVPDPKSKKLNWAPHDVLLQYFDETEDKPEKQDIRYILTLLLVRRRIFRLEEMAVDETGETMVVYCPQKDTGYTVPVVTLSRQRGKEIQELLSKLIVDAGSIG